MGYYIQAPTSHHKAEYLVTEHGAITTPQPASLSEVPSDKALIVVVDNGPFEAAGLVYNDSELRAFTQPDDYRPKRFVLLAKELAYGLAGFTPRNIQAV